MLKQIESILPPSVRYDSEPVTVYDPGQNRHERSNLYHHHTAKKSLEVNDCCLVVRPHFFRCFLAKLC